MPWLLYRMMLVDLLRVIGLTATVLVTVIAFGATIKPLTGDTLLDAGQTVKYLMLAIVPMLQFALPFAAGFGSTLALHRMTADNEVQAMAVSGLSYSRILAPVLALGLVLCVVMVALTQEVIPRFWSLIEQMIASDVTKMFQASIRRGEPFVLEDLQIYADEIVVEPWPEGLGDSDTPITRLWLLKVAAAGLGEDGRIVTDVTANRAVVDVYRREDETILKLAMYDAVMYKASGELGYAEVITPPAMIIPGVLRDQPKAKSRRELLALRRNPDTFAQVVEARQALAEAIRESEAREVLDGQLRSRGQVELAGDRRYTVNADRLVDGQFATRDGRRIEIIQSDNSLALGRVVTNSAALARSSDATLTEPRFDLVLGNCEVTDLRAGAGIPNMREQLSFNGLSIVGVSDDDLMKLSSDQLIERAGKVKGNQMPLRVFSVHKEIDSLQREITSRLMNRYALSVTAPLLLLLGAVMAMWLRRSLPLTIYVLAFLPAVLDLILTSGGEQLMRDGRTLGPVVMWSGNAIMLGIILLAYLRLSRH